MIKIDTIMIAVARHRQICVRDILGSSRKRPIAWARQDAQWLTRQLNPRFSFPKIGQQFGRDHTTVMHSIAAVQGRYEVDSAYRADMAMMLAELMAMDAERKAA